MTTNPLQPNRPSPIPQSDLTRLTPARQPGAAGQLPGQPAPAQTDSARLASIGALSASKLAQASRALDEASLAAAGLDRVSQSLEELRQALVARSLNPESDQSPIAAHQKKIDDIIQTITTVADRASRGAQGPISAGPGPDLQVSSVSPLVESVKLRYADLVPGQQADVDILVTGSAQVGGFLLSFGNSKLDLGAATEQFVIEIAGNAGSHELSFASGTALTDVAAAINSFADQTGVKARVSATTGLRLDTPEVGSDQFVSIRILDDGGIGGASNIGIYNFRAGDADDADAAFHRDFNATALPVYDYGKDVQGLVNTIAAQGHGRTLKVVHPAIGIEVTLTRQGASLLQRFDAFTISAHEPAPLGSRPSSPDQPDVSPRPDPAPSSDAIAALEQARSLIVDENPTAQPAAIASLSRALDIITEQRFTLGELTSGLLRTIRAISGPTGSPPVDPAALRESIINTLSANPSAVPGALTGNTNPTGSLNRLN